MAAQPSRLPSRPSVSANSWKPRATMASLYGGTIRLPTMSDRKAKISSTPQAISYKTAALVPPADAIGDAAPAMPVHRVAVADGTSIEVAPRVIEASDLKASSDKGYDTALQPRERDRAASQAQILEIAGNLDPERLGMSAEGGPGAPPAGAAAAGGR